MRNRLTMLLCMVVFPCLFLNASPKTVVLTKGEIFFDKKTSIEYYEDDSKNGLTYASARKKKFKPLGQLRGKLDPSKTYWARYKFRCKDPGTYFFYFGKGEHITVYREKSGGPEEVEIGEFVPRSKAQVKSISKSAKYTFKKGEEAEFLVRIKNETNFPPRISLSVSDVETFQSNMMFGRLSWQILFHAAVWMMIFYTIFLYFNIGDRAYLYYILYMVVLSLSFFLHDQIHYHFFRSLAEYPRVMYFAEIVFGHLSIVMYFLFMQKMLNTKKNFPFWHKITVAWIILKIIALPFAIYYNTYHLEGDTLLNGMFLADFVLLFLTSIVLLFKRDKVAIYFALGSLILALFGLITILGWVFPDVISIGRVEHLIQFGIIGQIILFSLGLGFKTRRNASLVFDLQKQNEDLVGQLKGKVNEQEKTLRMFMRYVPEPVVAKALNKTDENLFEGEMRHVAALFCDIRSFTSISEELQPRQVVRFLNDFYSVMTVVIKKYGGSVNMFIGDEIFAVFGAPLSTTNNERRAVLAAIEMIEKIKHLNEKYQPDFRRPIQVGIGVNSGEVVAGNMGSEEKIEYSVSGDTVNTAKRLESLTKDMPNTIIVSESVYRKVAPLVVAKELEEVSLKGKRNAMKTYQILGKK